MAGVTNARVNGVILHDDVAIFFPYTIGKVSVI